MSKRNFLILLMITALTVPANAQFNLGGLVKKTKKAVTETVKSNADATVDNAKEEIKASVVGNNPFKDVWQINDIKAYGVKTSENFGKVWLVINAEALVPLQYGYVSLGGTINKTYAVIDGKTYKPDYDNDSRFELPEGVPMELDTKEAKGIYLENIPASATEIQAYNMYIYIDPSRHQTVLWKHIPITWE